MPFLSTAAYSMNLKVALDNVPNTLGCLATAIGSVGANIVSMGGFDVRGDLLIDDIVVNCRDEPHAQAVLAAVKDQAAQLRLIAKAPAIWDIVQRNVSTDLGFLDLLRYTKYGLGLDMSSIHSHVFSNRELQSTKLPQSGAYVLFPKEEGVMADVMENIFAYVPISVQGTHPQGCPPPPAWAAEYLAALTPTPAPQ